MGGSASGSSPILIVFGAAVESHPLTWLNCSLTYQGNGRNSSGQRISVFLGSGNRLLTLCERSATVLRTSEYVQQFVNRVQLIATFAVAKTASRQPKTR